MVDEGQTRFAATEQVMQPLIPFVCRRHLGERCRLAVWALVVAAFAAGFVMPMSAKADDETAARPLAARSAACGGHDAHKLVTCPSPRPSPRP
ncbi:hypothetical protein Skr01_21140 [Sphaerisporangium krabiense]|uniref:Uncharacterized protein n=1 Tax=Sphaerisporangium krabiense TaxID=763782 RepID=A0A7W8Z5Y6_9ACTN|nr:hypothetical protein [Sphaerisporangium krabiense]MBB5627870.1 hypothetical protein [Sphaerisporangium krabiense]GII62029.1 hypothetical protein Skr01_21140 [Sphaerisporangium krabiense]